jgi:DNA repair photolyase
MSNTDGGLIMLVREITAKSVLSASKVHDYVVNPYTGCEHACTYCYARYMKRFTGHKEPWGDFVDVKINAPDVLRVEIGRKKTKGSVWVSGVCDPYQPLEAKYGLTRRCLEVLARADWPIVVQTRSPLVLRDLDILKTARHAEVGFSVTTLDDSIRELFEPKAPPIPDRLDALDLLHRAGITTYAMIAPLLPGAEGLSEALQGKVDYVLVDRMNYTYAAWVYRKHGFQDKLTDEFFDRTSRDMAARCGKLGIHCRVV